MKNIRSNIDLFLSTKRIYRNTKANCASRVSCKTLYQIGKIPRSGDKLEGARCKSSYIHVYKI